LGKARNMFISNKQSDLSKWHCPLIIAGLCIAGISYFYGLDSIHIPGIGDESPYIQITRLTAESGKCLPLLSDQGVLNTKPPLLFWQGMLSTNWGQCWHLWNLRIPVVLYSFLIAFTIGYLTGKITGSAFSGYMGGLIYLGFLSTIQQGRPFLVHAPETLFLFLPLVIIFNKERISFREAIFCGLSLGMAALYKSFFLVFAGCFALSLVLLHRTGFRFRSCLRRYGLYLLLMLVIGIGMFLIWPLLDPHPDLVFSQFFLEEHGSKFDPGAFFKGLFAGNYTLFRIWLGNFANGGLYFLIILALLIDLVMRRDVLTRAEKQLWIYILAFLIIYSFPTQRQENYILPTCAALSVLLALRWNGIPPVWFRISYGIAILMSAALLWLPLEVNRCAGDALFTRINYGAAIFLLSVSLFGLVKISHGRFLFPIVILGIFLTVSLFLRPFSQHFKPETCTLLKGQTVYFPSNFRASEEKYRFILPGADIRSYPQNLQDKVIHQFPYCAMHLGFGETVPEGFTEVDRIYTLKSRHSNQEIRDMLFKRRYELLIGRLVIVQNNQGG